VSTTSINFLIKYFWIFSTTQKEKTRKKKKVFGSKMERMGFWTHGKKDKICPKKFSSFSSDI
jgi:hypothetical protein